MKRKVEKKQERELALTCFSKWRRRYYRRPAFRNLGFMTFSKQTEPNYYYSQTHKAKEIYIIHYTGLRAISVLCSVIVRISQGHPCLISVMIIYNIICKGRQRTKSLNHQLNSSISILQSN